MVGQKAETPAGTEIRRPRTDAIPPGSALLGHDRPRPSAVVGAGIKETAEGRGPRGAERSWWWSPDLLNVKRHFYINGKRSTKLINQTG
jgi:hypothetical protein